MSEKIADRHVELKPGQSLICYHKTAIKNPKRGVAEDNSSLCYWSLILVDGKGRLFAVPECGKVTYITIKK